MKYFLGISNFVEELSSLFLNLFALVTEEGFLIPPCYSVELCIQMGISFLFSFAFSFSFFFFSQLFVRAPQTILPFGFLFIGDGFDHCLLYNVMNLHP